MGFSFIGLSFVYVCSRSPIRAHQSSMSGVRDAMDVRVEASGSIERNYCFFIVGNHM